ncbi:MAG: hypothetical protein DWQ10_14915 [Calditrichaeota bacterium]|nr:MAG: hypothetical protein DWQ10_14915 [Calditrichota bacterium]
MKSPRRLYPKLLAAIPALLILFICSIGLYIAISNLSGREKEILTVLAHRNLAVLILTGLVALAALITMAHYFIVNYFIPLHEIAEEIQLITSGNAKHRLKERGSGPVLHLIESVNLSATVFESMQENISESIKQANQQHEREKTILASLISQLESGVLICNLEGLILLYNKQARSLLKDNNSGEPGLGRSLLGIFDKNTLSHTLWAINAKIQHGSKIPSSVFLYGVGGKNTLRIRTVPIINEENNLQGYILLMRDITDQVQSHGRHIQIITNLSDGLRGVAANIRSAFETIIDSPEMKAGKRKEVHDAILADVHLLQERIQRDAGGELSKLGSKWGQDDILLMDVLQIVRRMALEQLELVLNFEEKPQGFWVSANLYSLAVAILYLMNKIKKLAGVHSIDMNYSGKEDFIQLAFSWSGPSIAKDKVKTWGGERLLLNQSAVYRTLNEVLNEHHAAVWLHDDEASSRNSMQLQLPVLLEPAAEQGVEPMDLHSVQPQFYDFDLFHQAGQKGETDDKPLTALSYTVFDTETTGLDPSGGDEIISIGAVRIVNGRLLATETFDQLINPKRKLTGESIKVHGILPEMLTGQPTVETVLPRFHKFSRDTILVAHNAAFDMKFLQIKEGQSHVIFDNPILDTLLLSSLIHTNLKEHNLDALCKRFGVKNIGRHSALGDALATAEVFLKIIPFLEKAGIKTLKQAREASEKNFYNKLKY